ncbi:MAG: hypothetical protein ACXWJ4_10565 [Methyloceanibacter sp.]
MTGLGSMLNKVREAEEPPPTLTDAYDELDDVNAYTRLYMHGEAKRNTAIPQVSAEESDGFVGKVLEIAGALTDAPSGAA